MYKLLVLGRNITVQIIGINNSYLKLQMFMVISLV